jgi:hypothetical protein
MIEVSYVSVLLAAVGAYAVGALWYSVLFGKKWQALMGFTPESMRAMKMTPALAMSLGFVSTLVMTYMLAHFSAAWGVADLRGALTLGALVWLGFQATILIQSYLYEGRSLALFVLNGAHQLIATLVAAVLLQLI